MDARFPGVGGHAESIFYGENTSDGHKTLRKPTTAWEMIYYLGMHFSEQLLSRLNDCSASWTSFVRSMRELNRFTPRFFAARFPEAWAPQSDALRSEIERLGGMEFIKGKWLKASEAGLWELWILLFCELFEGSLCVLEWSEGYDRPLWGLGMVDETSCAREPAVLDVKIGFLHYSQHTSQDKVARIDRREEGSLCRSVALRPCGFRHFIHGNSMSAEHSTTELEKMEKWLGFSISEDELSAVLRCFPSTVVRLLEIQHPLTGVEQGLHRLCVNDCFDSSTQARRRVITEAVESLLYFFQETTEGRYLIENMAFVSTSLLFVYDAAGCVHTVRVCLIDFARSSYRRLNYDEGIVGFIQGLQNVVRYLSTPVRLHEASIQADEKHGATQHPE